MTYGKYTYKVHKLPDGSITVTCGAWIVLRRLPQGTQLRPFIRVIDYADAEMLRGAEIALENALKDS